MTDKEIIEAAARALQDSGDEAIRAVDAQFYAAVVIDAVTPLIEDAYARKLDAAEEIARKGNEYTKGWKLLEDDGSVTTLGEEDHASIRAAALEEAAVVVEEHPEYPGEVGLGDQIAAAIRALKPASPSPSDASA